VAIASAYVAHGGATGAPRRGGRGGRRGGGGAARRGGRGARRAAGGGGRAAGGGGGRGGGGRGRRRARRAGARGGGAGAGRRRPAGARGGARGGGGGAGAGGGAARGAGSAGGRRRGPRGGLERQAACRWLTTSTFFSRGFECLVGGCGKSAWSSPALQRTSSSPLSACYQARGLPALDAALLIADPQRPGIFTDLLRPPHLDSCRAVGRLHETGAGTPNGCWPRWGE